MILAAVSSAFAAEPLKWSKLPPIPDALGVAAPYAGVSGTSLIVAGGANFPGGMPWEGGKKVWHDRVWALDKPDGKWREAGKLPRPLGYGVSVTARGGLVCVGGSDADRHYADTFLVTTEPDGFRIKPLAPLPIPLANMAGSLVGDSVFVAGGAEAPGEKEATNRAFMLSLEKNEWKEIAPLPGKARILAMAASDGERFMVFGGVALVPATDGKIVREYLRDAWAYGRKGWSQLPDMPRTVAAAPSPLPVIGGRWWILGGDDGSRFGFQPVEKHPGFPGVILAFKDDKWTESGVVPASRATVPVTVWHGAAIIPSGEARPGVRSPEVWRLDAADVAPSNSRTSEGRQRIRAIGR